MWKSNKDDESNTLSENMLHQNTVSLEKFPYNRCRTYKALDQQESKVRVKLVHGKSSGWSDRYAILYCDMVLLYECKSHAQTPLDSDLPHTILPLEMVHTEGVKVNEEKVVKGGLIPRTIFYENCVELPYTDQHGRKEAMMYLQLPDQDALSIWILTLRRRVKLVAKHKDTFDPVLARATIEDLLVNYPITTQFRQAPPAGGEEPWIQAVGNYHLKLQQHRQLLRRAQLFVALFTSTYATYLIWFATPGGEADVVSLERDLTFAEERIVQPWIEFAQAGIDDITDEFTRINKTDPTACNAFIAKVHSKLVVASWYLQYYQMVYPDQETTAQAKEVHARLAGLIEKTREQLIHKIEERRALDRDILANDPFLTDSDDVFGGGAGKRRSSSRLTKMSPTFR